MIEVATRRRGSPDQLGNYQGRHTGPDEVFKVAGGTL